MKSLKTIGVIAILGSSSVLADPAADSGLVSVFTGQTARLHVVNLIGVSNTKTCSFDLSFVDAAGNQVGTSLAVNNLGGNQSQTLSISAPAVSPTAIRAHIDFAPQVAAGIGLADPLNGCYRLAPTFEVSDGNSTQVLDTRFYGMPSPEKGKKLEKVKVCHKSGTSAEKTLEIPLAALKGHVGHGDSVGECDDDD